MVPLKENSAEFIARYKAANAADRALSQYRAADNMTDRQGALMNLVTLVGELQRRLAEQLLAPFPLQREQ